MFLLTLFLTVIPSDSFAGQYDHAIKVTTNAVAKQTGLEANFFKVRNASNKALVKFAREKGLEVPLAVVSFVVPIVYRKQVRIRTGDFVFKGVKDKVTLDWQVQF